jgi:isopentenyldiphosphate isomerase
MNAHPIIIPAIAEDGSLYPVEKLKAHEDGLFHLAISIFVFDGEHLLIQKGVRPRSITAAACGPIPAVRIPIGTSRATAAPAGG